MKVVLAGWHTATKYNPSQGAYGLDDEADIEGARLVYRVISAKTLRKREAKSIGVILHFGFGAAAGASYALALEKVPSLGAGHGALFGAGLWLIGDEAAVALSGISDPRNKTLMSHVVALFAHIVFGVITDLSVRSPLASTRGARLDC